MATIETGNDLMYAIAKRVKDIADLPIRTLREMAYGYGCDTDAEARRLAGNATRGTCLEILITEEFEDMFIGQSSEE